MPDDPGEEITELHRLGQARIGAGLSREVLERWRRVSPTSLEESAGVWLRDSLGLTRTYRRRSRELSAAYVRLLRAFRTNSTLPPLTPGPRRDEVLLGELRQDFGALVGVWQAPRRDDAVRVTVDEDVDWPEPDEESDDRRATVSLVVSGPVRVQRAITALRLDEQRGRLDDADFLADLSDAMDTAGAEAAGAADREALMGGRDLLEDSSRADGKVIGWARVTDSDPCHFCALLASRGAVYRSQWSASFRGGRHRTDPRPAGFESWSADRMARWEESRGLQRYHDNCHCTIVPVYSRTDWLPEESKAFRELYYAATEGLSGREARAAFRRAIEERRRRARARNVTLR